MIEDAILHLHNEPGVSQVRVGTKQFMCIGALPPFDHPHVFIDMGDSLEIVCPYCSTIFQHAPELEEDCEPMECVFSSDSTSYRSLSPDGIALDSLPISETSLHAAADDWLNDWLNEQRLAYIISGFLTLIFIVKLTYSDTVGVAIIWWFLFLLSIFHFTFFFFLTSITQRHVKMIDYPYLLIGAFGILLAFMGSQEDRAKNAKALGEILAPSTAAGLQHYIHDTREQFCLEQDDYVPKNFCQWTNHIVQFFNNKYTPEELDQEIVDAERSARISVRSDDIDILDYYRTEKGLAHLAKRALSSVRKSLSIYSHPQIAIQELTAIMKTEPVFLGSEIAVDGALIITSMRKIRDRLLGKTTEAMSSTDQSDVRPLEPVLIGLGKELVWPFVLAIALALRLTKVTADVLGWAKA
jgi:uncharacterized Zn-finger protein